MQPVGTFQTPGFLYSLEEREEALTFRAANRWFWFLCCPNAGGTVSSQPSQRLPPREEPAHSSLLPITRSADV